MAINTVSIDVTPTKSSAVVTYVTVPAGQQSTVLLNVRGIPTAKNVPKSKAITFVETSGSTTLGTLTSPNTSGSNWTVGTPHNWTPNTSSNAHLTNIVPTKAVKVTFAATGSSSNGVVRLSLDFDEYARGS